MTAGTEVEPATPVGLVLHLVRIRVFELLDQASQLVGTAVGQLQEAIVEALAPYSELLEVHSSVSCVDVTPAGIDKGAGARWLSAETGIPLAAMGGIGDSPNDLPFLRLAGRSAAPSNAADQVRAAVDYVSPYENGEGVLDILRHWRTASLRTASLRNTG